MTLEKAIIDRGSLPWREVVELGIQICDALHYAHERGVVHRDLKPSNLMVTNDGKIKLTDFGIAKDLDKTALTATGRTLGTAAYMAPEQIRGTPAVSHKTDLYALGIVLYQMLVGKPAFEGSSPVVLMHCHLNESPPRASAAKIHGDSQGARRAGRELDGQGPRRSALGRGGRRRHPDRAARQGRPWKRGDDRPWSGPTQPRSGPPGNRPGAAPPRTARSAGDADAAEAEPARKKNPQAPARLTGRPPAERTNRLREFGFPLESHPMEPRSGDRGTRRWPWSAIGGFIAYCGSGRTAKRGPITFTSKAEVLMASSRRADWLTARDEYLNPLDRNAIPRPIPSSRARPENGATKSCSMRPKVGPRS